MLEFILAVSLLVWFCLLIILFSVTILFNAIYWMVLLLFVVLEWVYSVSCVLLWVTGLVDFVIWFVA